MADTTLPGLLATGDHASRPAASAVGTGALYSCTTHGLVYQSDGSSWSTWATLGGGSVDAADVTADTSGFGNASGDDVQEVLGELDAAITSAGSGGAPTTVKYLVGALDGGLSAEKVKAGLYVNYDPDEYPTSGTALTDEFDDGSVAGGWGWTGTTPTYDETTYPGFLYVDTAKNITNKFRIAYVPGATAFTVAAKVALAVRNQDNAAMAWGIATFDSSDNILWQIYLQTSGNAAAVDDVRIFGTAGTGGTVKVGFGRWVYLALQRDSGGVYTAYWSLNGMIWNLFGSSTVGTTVAKVGFTIPTNDNNGNNRQTLTDFIRVFSSATLKIGA